MVTMPAVWERRIVGQGEESPAELIANPLNYRRHPPHQRAALQEMLDSVGWVQQVVVNRRTGHLVDGHLRVELAQAKGAPAVPVLYVDLDESEERLVLAALDPIGALAHVDAEALESLLEDVAIDGEQLNAMLADVLAAPPPIALDPEGKGDGLEALDVSVADPEHEVAHGEVWKLGQHTLFVGSVHHDWPAWTPLLGEGVTLAPYPTPMLAVLYTEGPLLMVQPDPYLAGHVIDKWASRFGDAEKLR